MVDLKLLKTNPKAKPKIIKVVIFKTLALIMNISFLFGIKYMIDNRINSIVLWILIQVSFIIFKNIFNRISVKESNKAGRYVKTNLRSILYDHLMKETDLKSHFKSSELTQIMGEGVEQLEIYFSLYLPQFFYSLIAPLILFIVISQYSLKVSLVLLVMVPMIPISIVFVQKIAKRILSRYWDSYLEMGSLFLDSLQGLGTLKSFNYDEKMHDLINEESESFRKATMRVLVMQLNSISVMDLVAYGGSVIAIILAYFQFEQNRISLGTFILFVLISSEFFIPMRQLGSYFHIAMNGLAASDRIFEFLDYEEKLDLSNLPNEFEKIHAHNLSYAYGEKLVLENINFEIKHKSFVSFVGESGSGKSTVLNLLIKNLETDNLYLDDKNYNNFNLYNKMTIVSSQSELFKGTVRSNLEMSGITDEKSLNDILEKVSLDTVFASREGLDTIITERGSNLSGGERQRLILARALLKDSDIYLLDEITSNIDRESETIIMNNINSLTNKTIVMVSHRLLNVIGSDMIYVLDKGKIIEEGTYESLLNEEGHFAKLVETQKELEKVLGGEDYA